MKQLTTDSHLLNFLRYLNHNTLLGKIIPLRIKGKLFKSFKIDTIKVELLRKELLKCYENVMKMV